MAGGLPKDHRERIDEKVKEVKKFIASNIHEITETARSLVKSGTKQDMKKLDSLMNGIRNIEEEQQGGAETHSNYRMLRNISPQSFIPMIQTIIDDDFKAAVKDAEEAYKRKDIKVGDDKRKKLMRMKKYIAGKDLPDDEDEEIAKLEFSREEMLEEAFNIRSLAEPPFFSELKASDKREFRLGQKKLNETVEATVKQVCDGLSRQVVTEEEIEEVMRILNQLYEVGKVFKSEDVHQIVEAYVRLLGA
jgi:hypothetical protein